MKSILSVAAFVSCMLLTFGNTVNAQSKTKMYWESISNADKSLAFLAAVYPEKYEFVQGTSSSYSTLKMCIINKSTNVLNWTEEEKVLVLLKDGKMLCSYTTASSSGDYANKYDINKEDTHCQILCFKGDKFGPADIAKVYLMFGGAKVFELVYEEVDASK